ncbi:TlyA family RNA methyltransferase [Hyphococcus lacteus]|uniref:TlyA family RNA methyltransferase n=1 Tax=Hyphococcus lacteus TaxID=3143536 RepID=A0ABV3Z4Q5_9PROT
MRLDHYLTQHGLFESRARAQEAVTAGLVRINGITAIKPAQKVADDASVTIEGAVHPYVSRGGLKLEAALDHFGFDPSGQICLDLGASTGGFCDVLLRRGATRIYAVDVGQGQLHEKIVRDERVINLEKTHAKDLNGTLVPEKIALIVCDVSFIGLKKALPFAMSLAAVDANMVALIKPQFEVGKAGLGKGGIVKPGLAGPVVEDLTAWMNAMAGWSVIDVIDSPIVGGDGNKEFLLGATKSK